MTLNKRKKLKENYFMIPGVIPLKTELFTPTIHFYVSNKLNTL